MRKIAVVHPHKTWWCWDLLYKQNWLDRLLKRKPRSSLMDYGDVCCPVAEEWEARGFKCFCSGDTEHTELYLRDLGLDPENPHASLIKRLTEEGFEIFEQKGGG